jgi:hypothetical protein
MEQLAINIGSILLAGILTLSVQRQIFIRRRREHRRQRRPEAGAGPLRS